MARKRMIEVSIAYDEHLNSVSEFAELIFYRILPHTDDFGRFSGSPKVIKARALPMRDKRTARDIAEAIYELIDIGLLRPYCADGKLVLQFNEESFARINAVLVKNNKSGSEYPEPTEFMTLEEYQRHVRDTCETLTIVSKKYKVDSIKYKVKSKKGKNEKFELFWSKYPRKTNKATAEKSFEKIDPDDELFDTIILAVDNQIKFGMLNNGQYTPHASTWLNQERWNDQVVLKEKQNGTSIAPKYAEEGKSFNVIS